MESNRKLLGVSPSGRLVAGALGIGLCLWGAALADTLSTTRVQITDTSAHEYRPTLGANVVIYTSQDFSQGASARVYGWMLDDFGQRTGLRIEVSDDNGFDADDRLNDVSGSSVVYSSTVLGVTRLVVYDLGTESRSVVVSDAGSVFDVRIEGDRVVFVQAGAGSTFVRYVDKTNPAFVATLSGPAASRVAIGSDLVVWAEAGSEVWAFNPVTQDFGLVEQSGGSNPVTDGDWVVYEHDIGTEVEIVAKQLSLAPNQGAIQVVDTVVVAPQAHGVVSPRNPDIDGDLIAYEAVPAGGIHYEIYVYRLSDGATFQVTNDGVDHELNSIYGDKVAYGDYQSGEWADIWLSTLAFIPDEPQVTLYGVDTGSDALSVIDRTTGSSTFVGPLDPDPAKLAAPASMAVHPWDGRLFVWNNGDAGGVTGVLLTVDPCTGLATPVDPTTPPQGFPVMGALAFAPDGQLFGSGGNDLHGIDPTTGVRTLIGPMTGLAGIPAGLDFDATGTLFVLASSQPQNPPLQVLGTVDTTTGAATWTVPLDLDVGTTGSIVFAPDGTLIGSAFGPQGDILFDIDPVTAVVSNIRAMNVGAPQGMGFAPECLIAVAPTAVILGEVEVGSSANAIVTLTNTGGTNLTASTLSLASGSSGFSITMAPSLPTAVPPAGTVDVEITFAPWSEGPASDVLEIIHSAGLTRVGLRGEGVLVDTPSQQIAGILDVFDSSVAVGTLQGSGAGNSASGRLGALRNMIEAAGDLIEDGLIDEACQQLLDALKRTDGLPKPPDFAAGSAAAGLATLIQVLRADLGCL